MQETMDLPDPIPPPCEYSLTPSPSAPPVSETSSVRENEGIDDEDTDISLARRLQEEELKYGFIGLSTSTSVSNDEELARKMQQEMEDTQLAMKLQYQIPAGDDNDEEFQIPSQDPPSCWRSTRILYNMFCLITLLLGGILVIFLFGSIIWRRRNC